MVQAAADQASMLSFYIDTTSHDMDSEIGRNGPLILHHVYNTTKQSSWKFTGVETKN